MHVKSETVEKRWYVADASGKVLGRFASRVAATLKGKHKPIYSPHTDVGDHIIIINAEKVRLTGNKAQKKKYYWHTGYPGGLKSISYERLIKEKPERVLEKAIKGMLPHNVLGRNMFRKLRVYAGPDHPHRAQNPQPMDF